MAALDTSKFKPGQNLVCTISADPKTDDQVATIARLMRMDPENKKALRRAQRMRRQRMVVYNRGNRDWYSREKAAKVVHVAKGKSWTMPYSRDMDGSLAAVASFVTIKAS
jgi:hypothetical protein